MSVDRHHLSEQLFYAALKKTPQDREAFLFQECKGDGVLFREVLELLKHHDSSDAFLDRPLFDPTREEEIKDADAAFATEDAETQKTLVTSMGRYDVLDVLGEGGMGIVYLANQTEPVRRRVALKVVKLDATSTQAKARFEAERQALALMNHPNIASVYEAGTTSDSRLYFAMEYIPGLPITEFCDKAKLGIRDRLDLFSDICEAIHHAHQKGIIHRDIKPSNVLVSTESGRPTPKIIDFGVAKALHRPLISKPLHTVQGTVVGSFEYMSPEQADLGAVDVDTRADIYSLGVLLHELLLGMIPIDIEEARAIGYAEIERRVRTEEPPRLSQRISQLENPFLSKIASERSVSPASLRKLVTGDLEWVVAKALEKDRFRRYASASEFSADIRRFLANEPVQAGPPSRTTQFRNFVRRNRALVTGVLAVMTALALGLVVSLWLFLENREATQIAQAQRDDILQLSDKSRLATCIAEARELVPPHPETVPAMKAWLNGPAKALAERLPHHRTKLNELLAQNAIAAGVTENREPQFESSEDQFHYDLLSGLVSDLEKFVDPDPAVGTIAEVTARLKQAQSLYSESIENHRQAWASAIASIASEEECPAYRGLEIEPQLGLVPLHRNQQTGLWEFVHVQSGELPAPKPDGTFLQTTDTGLIMVLMPPGDFWMGAESPPGDGVEIEGRIFRHTVRKDESPIHRVTLDPFFISKYEMTQARWVRTTGINPSRNAPAAHESQDLLRRPVEHIDWMRAEYTTRAIGLTLPTEAQWEFAARGGVAAPWWCGSEKADLAECANLQDLTLKAGGGPVEWPYEPWYDGSVNTALVGTYRPNPYGLYDVIGNVWEWCLDAYAPYTAAVRQGDGLRSASDTKERVLRGGCFNAKAEGSRVTRRANLAPVHHQRIGVRPARLIQSGHGAG